MRNDGRDATVSMASVARKISRDSDPIRSDSARLRRETLLCCAKPGPMNPPTRAHMKTGFLTLETHPDHNGLVRVRMRDRMPALAQQKDGAAIRYVARFQDVEAAQMHVQNMMHARLVNLEKRIYRKPLADMIACVEADELDHTKVWMDPALDQQARERIASLVDRHRRRHKAVDLVWRTIGLAALLLLLITSLNP